MPSELTLVLGPVGASMLIFAWSMVLTFALEYFPWIKVKFEALPAGEKKTLNAAGIGIIAGGLYLLSLAGVVDAYAPTLTGFVTMVSVYMASLGIQYGVHAQTKRT